MLDIQKNTNNQIFSIEDTKKSLDKVEVILNKIVNEINDCQKWTSLNFLL